MVIAAAALAGQTAEPGAAAGTDRATTVLALTAIAIVSLALAFRRGWLGMPAAPLASPRPNPAPSLVVLALAMPLLGSIGSTVARRWMALPDPPELSGQVWMLVGASLAELPAAIGIALLLPARRVAWPVAVFLGLFACALAFPAVQSTAALAGWVQQLVSGIPPPAVAHHTLEQMVTSHDREASLAMLILVVAVIPPLEEIAYRGGLQTGLRFLGFGPWSATLATSVAFAFMHVGAIPESGLASALLGLLILSIGLGILRERTGSLVAPAVAHALFNLTNVLVARG